MSRSRTGYFAALAVLTYAALVPGSWVERGLDWMLLPSRAAGELARPFGVFARGDVRAAEIGVAQHAGELVARSRALLERAGACALPRDTALATRRGFVHAQAVERSAKTPDVVVVQYAPSDTIVPELPVAAGDFFLGRVVRLFRTRAGEAEVELVTAPSFRVGAEVAAPDGTSAGLVVGGVAQNPEGDPHGLYLAVHAPSRQDLANGTVRVRELALPGRDAADHDVNALADGFVLGELVRYDAQGVSVLSVRAAFDFDAGPYELVVLTPPERAEAGPPLARDPFAPERWTSARFVAFGTPSAGREARVLDAGARAGVENLAALCSGGALVGRVEHTAPWSSTAQLVGDPGFSVQALAQLADSEEPLALGRITSLGRESGSNALLFRWENALDARAPGARDAQPVLQTRAFVVTGWGERHVPAGLVLGWTELPLTPGTHVLRIEPALDARDLAHVLVWQPVLAPQDEL